MNTEKNAVLVTVSMTFKVLWTNIDDNGNTTVVACDSELKDVFICKYRDKTKEKNQKCVCCDLMGCGDIHIHPHCASLKMENVLYEACFIRV